MKKMILILAIMCLIASCASTNSKETLLRPGGAFMNPWEYIDTFPIGQVTEEQLFEQIGPSDNTSQTNNKIFHTYNGIQGSQKTGFAGLEMSTSNKFIFIVEGGTVTDVIFSPSVKWPGTIYNAKKRQSK